MSRDILATQKFIVSNTEASRRPTVDGGILPPPDIAPIVVVITVFWGYDVVQDFRHCAMLLKAFHVHCLRRIGPWNSLIFTNVCG